jgi:hypothetical protein
MISREAGRSTTCKEGQSENAQGLIALTLGGRITSVRERHSSKAHCPMVSRLTQAEKSADVSPESRKAFLSRVVREAGRVTDSSCFVILNALSPIVVKVSGKLIDWRAVD